MLSWTRKLRRAYEEREKKRKEKNKQKMERNQKRNKTVRLVCFSVRFNEAGVLEDDRREDGGRRALYEDPGTEK